MFEINSESNLYKTYYLHDRTSDSRVTVVPERGGIVTAVQIGDRDCLYLDGDRFRDPNKSVRGGIPILFPICGNLPDNCYEWEGKSYEMAQHGFARALPWTVTHTSTDGEAAITVSLSDSPETLKLYPFQFQLDFTYRWAGTRLAIEQTVLNRSQTPMPFCVGFHPYFSAPDKSNLRFELPVSSYYDRANDSNGVLERSWNFDPAEIDALMERFPDEVPAEASVRDGDYVVRFSCSPEFRNWVFWTLKDKPFYCLEPWSSPRNALNTGTDLLSLAPGKSHQASFVLDFEV